MKNIEMPLVQEVLGQETVTVFSPIQESLFDPVTHSRVQTWIPVYPHGALQFPHFHELQPISSLKL